MFHFRCDGCSLELALEYRPRVYMLDGGRELVMAQRHVFCARCRTVTPAEALTGDIDDDAFQSFCARRRRPPRCLRCANEAIALPDADWSDLPHPVCGGTLRCSATIVGGTFQRSRPHRYSIEGDFIEAGVRLARFEGEPDSPLELW